MTSKSEILEYVRENNVKFVKLTFCDMLGRQRNISVLSSQLEDAFEHGVAIDSAAVTGVGGVDLRLMPVSSLLSDLPWRPHSGKVVSVFCRLANIDCTPYACDPMVLLERQVGKLKELGLTAEVATECEFYVFKEVDDALEPIDNADYCACAPFDKCESLRRDVIL
ncbi:MAG: lengsin, partial [Clostridiales bacterium]|nr:lengsin [Clostridiales bacterium]